jgi:hypothetical protein
VGARFSAPVLTGPGAHPPSYTMGTGSLSRVEKRPRRGVYHPPHLAPSLRKEWSYTSPVGLRGLLWGELYFYLYLYYLITVLCVSYEENRDWDSILNIHTDTVKSYT